MVYAKETRGRGDADAAPADARPDAPADQASDSPRDAAGEAWLDAAPPPTSKNGDTCARDGDCLSGYCSGDLHCCNTSCTGPCRECASGVCKPIGAGSSARPGATCPKGTGCNTPDGYCDGFGACRTFAPSNTGCGSPACSTTTNELKLGSVCDGNGTCKQLGTMSCGSYKCNGNQCYQWCDTSATQCVSGVTCSNGQCNTGEPLGHSCTYGSECQSGYCSEGVCCDTDCSAMCKVCNHSAAKGHCINVPAGGNPSSPKTCGTTSPPCGIDGKCDGAGNCRATPAKTQCDLQCVEDAAGDYLQYSYCDGIKSCVPASPQKCGNYRCQTDVKSCFGRCTDSATHCNAGCKCNTFTAKCEC